MFSFLNWKSHLNKLLSPEKVNGFFDKAKELIIEYKEKAELTGPQKKAEVDKLLTVWVKDNFNSKNAIVTWLIENILIKYLPLVTQKVYDLIKLFVDNLTEKITEK